MVLRLVCAPASWRLFPGVLGAWAWPLAFCSGFCLLVRSRRVLLALLRRLVPSPGLFQKEATTQGTDQKTGFFSDQPTTCSAGSPWWPGMRGDDPRTDPLAGTPFYVQHYCGFGGGTWVLTLVFFVASSFFVFSSFARLFKPTGGGWWENLHV